MVVGRRFFGGGRPGHVHGVWGRRPRGDASHGCGSWWSRCWCGPTGPGPCGCRCRFQGGARRTNAGGRSVRSSAHTSARWRRPGHRGGRRGGPRRRCGQNLNDLPGKSFARGWLGIPQSVTGPRFDQIPTSAYPPGGKPSIATTTS